jgi:hypothetical protein
MAIRVVQAQQERTAALLPGDVLGGPLAEQVGVIAGLFHRHLALPEIRLGEESTATPVREVVDGPAEVAEELLVAALFRTEPGQKAEVPLAQQGGRVPGCRQQRRERGMLRRQTEDVGGRRPG